MLWICKARNLFSLLLITCYLIDCKVLKNFFLQKHLINVDLHYTMYMYLCIKEVFKAGYPFVLFVLGVEFQGTFNDLCIPHGSSL